MPKATREILPLSDPDKERFWKRVNKSGPDQCWLWIGKCINNKGYATFSFSRRLILVHRFAWVSINGEIPNGMVVCHKCDVPLCCNPDHLWIGTQMENVRDMLSKGRGPTGKKHGSKTHPESVPRGDYHYSRIDPSRAIMGEINGQSKLTDEIVKEMRQERVMTGIPYAKLGKKFGLSSGAARQAVVGITWKHIPPS